MVEIETEINPVMKEAFFGISMEQEEGKPSSRFKNDFFDKTVDLKIINFFAKKSSVKFIDNN